MALGAFILPEGRVRNWLGIAVFAGASLAGALSDAPAKNVETQLSPRLSVTLTGEIAAQCGVSGGNDLALGELRGNQSASSSFGLNCNVPFNVGVQALNGGLAHAETPRGQAAYAGQLNYSLRVTIPVLEPRPALLRADFQSAEIVSGRTISSGNAIAAGGGRIDLRTHALPESGLLAGDYHETLSLTIEPRV